MRISALAAEAGMPVATVKFYLREGLLHAGTPTSATQAVYDASHVRRLHLVRALLGSAGLSVQQARTIVAVIEAPGDDLYHALGRAVGALPPTPAVPAAAADGGEPFPRARAALESLGQVYDPDFAAVAQLESALASAEAAGLPVDDERLEQYGRHLAALAEFDLDRLPADPASAVEYTVLGTALHEPVLLALRRLAHQDAAVRRLQARPENG
ncbi:MerR family transcriptional regulator [Agromyces sp. CFH 90414]|uniref:MerR family transcriptional regulator n=1 Tax=Agromyces agglutinans TaxID=2662258 RepID=A0A6I2FEY6_9MICO|nr:MerR family transcriptional regulator [Agromyces agglutinans]MRG61116.1 MerR family transcriptional regulator [Agromyces agglutinans]